jgi:ribonuclease R/exosome complex exonuclease DIS3/RRP44
MSKKKNGKNKDSFNRRYKQDLLQYLTNNANQAFNYKQLAFQLNIVDDYNRGQLQKLLKNLLHSKQVKEVGRGKYKITHQSHYYEGIIDMSLSGKAFFMCDELKRDIYIPGRNLNHALHKDTVRVYSYHRQRSSSRQEGDVVEIIKRAKTKFVGVLQLHDNHGFVIPDDPRMYADFYISKKMINGAKDGEKVAVEMLDWPEISKNPFGKIIDILGKPGEHDTEIHSILFDYNLPYKFPEQVEKDAAKLPIEITKKEIAKRRDMRQTLTFTIDPKDAKDFDDALSFEVLPNGNFEIGIHIADVSHYVHPDSLLEEEAYKRATSVYLVDRVVPMLPEILSNNVCSLRPNEEKLTFSAIFEINAKAQVLKQWFGRTIIYSDARFAYEEAQEIIEKNPPKSKKLDLRIPKDISLSGKEYQVKKEIAQAVLKLDELAKKLRANRMESGAITFDKTEVRFELNKDNEPIGILFKRSKEANKLIEEFMLLANRKVAEFIGRGKDGKPSKKTFVYRIHDEPNVEKLGTLQQIIGKFGYTIDTRSVELLSKSINKLLNDVKGTPEQNMVETLTIRSMSKAIYTTENIGHYGLSFAYYSHFTSPIRRYPDVMTHRLLQHYLDGNKSPQKAIYEEKCKHSSEREQLATKAERDSIKYMQVKFMQAHLHEEFEGVISGITDWGLFVELTDNMCEGMVRIKDIKQDYFLFDEKQYAIVGQATQQVFRLGDKVRISVKSADLEKKQLDFTLLMGAK